MVILNILYEYIMFIYEWKKKKELEKWNIQIKNIIFSRKKVESFILFSFFSNVSHNIHFIPVYQFLKQEFESVFYNKTV